MTWGVVTGRPINQGLSFYPWRYCMYLRSDFEQEFLSCSLRSGEEGSGV